MSAFTTMSKLVRSRNFGGTKNTYSCEPYLSGYSYIKWFLPKTLEKYLSPLSSVPNSESDHQSACPSSVQSAELFLSQSCVSVTTPTQQMTTTQHQASSGVVFKNISKIKYGEQINIKYLEMSGLPIFKIHKAWIEYMRDARCGYQVTMTKGGKPEQKCDYAGNIYYWTTKPDGYTVEFAALYTGVYPMRDTQDAMSFDIGSVDKVELDYEYNIDYVWNAPWVFKYAQKYAKTDEYYRNTMYGSFGITKEEEELKEE